MPEYYSPPVITGNHVSWHPEPECWRVNAFPLIWNNTFYYIFPPFSLISRVARKIRTDNSHAVLIVPTWNTQPWLAAVTSAAKSSMHFPRKVRNLQHQGAHTRYRDVSTTPLTAFLFWEIIYLDKYGLDKITKTRLMSHTWRKGTVRLYTHYLKKWGFYCLLKKVKPLNPTIAQILRFLRLLEDEGLGFGAINMARCTLCMLARLTWVICKRG